MTAPDATFMQGACANAGAAEQRLDKWLWHARLCKSRTLAAKVIEAGLVRLNRVRVEKPSQCVKRGDVLTLAFHERVRVIEVVSIAERRSPAQQARLLYLERALAESEGDLGQGRGAARV